MAPRIDVSQGYTRHGLELEVPFSNGNTVAEQQYADKIFEKLPPGCMMKSLINYPRDGGLTYHISPRSVLFILEAPWKLTALPRVRY